MWLAVSCDRGVTPIVMHSTFSSAAYRENWKDLLFLAAGFARVAIKELFLGDVPNRTPPVK